MYTHLPDIIVLVTCLPRPRSIMYVWISVPGTSVLPQIIRIFARTHTHIHNGRSCVLYLSIIWCMHIMFCILCARIMVITTTVIMLFCNTPRPLAKRTRTVPARFGCPPPPRALCSDVACILESSVSKNRKNNTRKRRRNDLKKKTVRNNRLALVTSRHCCSTALTQRKREKSREKNNNKQKIFLSRHLGSYSSGGGFQSVGDTDFSPPPGGPSRIILGGVWWLHACRSMRIGRRNMSHT